MSVSLHLVPSGPPVWMRSMATSVSALRDIVAPNAMKVGGGLVCHLSCVRISHHLTLHSGARHPQGGREKQKGGY